MQSTSYSLIFLSSVITFIISIYLLLPVAIKYIVKNEKKLDSRKTVLIYYIPLKVIILIPTVSAFLGLVMGLLIILETIGSLPNIFHNYNGFIDFPYAVMISIVITLTITIIFFITWKKFKKRFYDIWLFKSYQHPLVIQYRSTNDGSKFIKNTGFFIFYFIIFSIIVTMFSIMAIIGKLF
ncbi:hypothetical protein BN85408120 [Alteracholeplasma palmae J233]|uniref:Uncharacterized protein n=1 Tax=Alteracholeplasma palmae (strain ATCC 49389 / J233) TaxID=1318466 RepID=U4KKS3_ALTPJ|nr:hypothetical protein [Alteracholeplasma palmae]CCV64389.1 hypothetical protein BN85408120 [Alteracholeplasma palmae J233]